ncbi:carbohydrate ABC transporter substrate-binding protein, CUT1 family [Faunimonas pinastri]|uniref:Carbohydrate ABC transporter substrate-binding protein, CUT1 family n=1 Tax=Faunimonas pinastri TaxID=1855383 RepID=A0A1H9NHD4_9HYPH|nr:extracellular solute-binding protein [Faunimonas pinastri]SER35318.1 carbohydrate ABC transporter substrate-binding protein, CUT1 family [Faunimonas pinastri]
MLKSLGRRRAVRTLAHVGAIAGMLAGTLMVSTAALADTTVHWLHLEQNPPIVAYWRQVADEYEKAHPGVKIDMQYLENEAYKAKLTTLLQSKSAPDIIYSWGGGVLDEQIKAGVIKDITADVDKSYSDQFNPTFWTAFNRDGKQWGIPHLASEVAFFYNKPLMQKAGVDPTTIKTWDDFLAAVKKIKAAGITPIIAGGADKWPLHFYWSDLALRIGGEQAFKDAMAGKGDGFASQTFVKAGEMMKQLTDLQPFQPGYLGATAPDAYGQFGDGKGAMELMGDWLYTSQKSGAANGKGISDADLGMMEFPAVKNGAGKPTDTLGGVNGWLVTKNAPPETVDFLKFFVTLDHERYMANHGFFIPVMKGASDEMQNPIYKKIADDLTHSTYHQIFYDQFLGPNVGRVVNDVTTDLASGATTPKEAAQAVQDAWAMEH